jgi:hypothetical protein
MGAPCIFNVPGTVVNVVKSMAETAENVPVSFDISVDCPSQISEMELGGWAHLSHTRKSDESN